MMKFFRWVLGLCALCMALAVFAGFAGGLHPVFDTLSLVRLPLAGACLLVMVFPMARRLRLTLVAAAMAGLITTVPLFVGGAGNADMRVYSKNLWAGNRDVPALAADIRASGADVVMLQEVSRHNDALLTSLAPDFPHQHLCRFSGWSGNAVLSRQPISDTACSERRGAAAAQVITDGGPVWAVSVHLAWPFPYSNARTADQVTDVVAGLEGPVVLAGDFNIFPWAESVRQIQGAAALQAAQPIRPTFNLGGVPLLLDHVHAPGGGKASYRPLLGSDHRGVLADVALRPPAGPNLVGLLSGLRNLFP